MTLYSKHHVTALNFHEIPR